MSRTLTNADLARLHTLVAEYFERAGVDAEVGDFEVRLPDGEVFGLLNVFQRAAELPPAEWPDYLAWHFDSIRAVEFEVPAGYATAAPRLRIRLAPPDIAHLHHPDSRRPLCEGLEQVLMVRVDAGCFTLPPWAWERWDEDPDRVWADARERTVWDEVRERKQLLRPDGVQVGWIGGGFFASSMLLDLGRFLPTRWRQGAVVALPTVDALLYVPVDQRFPEATLAMIEIGTEWWQRGPHSLTADLFWWRDGIVSRIVSAEEGRFQPCWGADFSRALAEVEAEQSRKSG